MKTPAKILILVSCMTMGLIIGCPLTISIVRAPDINCKFDTDCTIPVTDSSNHFTIGPTIGDAFLQSRTFPQGEPGTAADGLYAYLYRIDLRQLGGVTALPCVTEFTIDFGPVVKIDYDGNGTDDDIFVITAGGIGSVAPSSVDQEGRMITFTFQPPICAGSSPGTGESSFFFGMASTKPPRPVMAEIKDSLGGVTILNARAPEI